VPHNIINKVHFASYFCTTATLILAAQTKA